MSALLPTTPEAASSGAELVTSDGRSLALVSAHLHGEASGGLARLVLEQRFENPYDENLRVTYRMPLPADGAVSGYEFAIGERTVKGVIDRKARARERFERAIASGKTAALLEQERADIFTQQIGNIPAREAVVARITIDQRLAWLPEGEWELRFPTVIGPRYIGSADTAADVRATHIKVTDQPLRAGIQISLAIRDAIAGGGKPSSPSHRVEQRGDGTVELHSSARLDRDIVLRWRVATPAVGLSLACARPASGNDAFGLLTIVPPARDAKPIAVARDLIVLLDTSGSMSGGPLDKAKQVIAMMLDSLDEQDRFELIEFSNEPRRYLGEPVAATHSAKQAAIKWLRSREADGATEMRAAVIEALTTLRVGAQRQVVVVTDGYVGGEHQILEALNRRLPRSCRLHVLGVGSAVNRSLASSLARAGRGVEVLVGIDEDAERGAKRLLDRTRMPVLTNVELGGSALLRHAPALVPDVFEGAPLVAAVAVRPEGGELVVRGQLARETWEQTIRVPAQRSGEGNQAIVALYGRERVADVEATAMFSSVDGEIEELGITFQIATRMTSWVAVDETRVVTGPSRDQLIPQELPYGTTASAFGLRAVAAPANRYSAGAVAKLYDSDAEASFSSASDDSLGGDTDRAELALAAPSSMFDDDGAPPAPRRGMMAASESSFAPPPGRMFDANESLFAPSEELEAEEPTGVKRKRVELELDAPPAPAPAEQAPARAQAPAERAREAAPAQAPAPRAEALDVPVARRAQRAWKGSELAATQGRRSLAVDRSSAMARAPRPRRRKRRLALAMFAVLAIIAILLWWLLA